MRKFEKYIEGLKEDISESSTMMIPAILGLIIMVVGIEISKFVFGENPPEYITNIIFILVFFTWGFVGFIGFRKSLFPQLIVAKGLFAKIFSVFFMLVCWGLALAALISIFV